MMFGASDLMIDDGKRECLYGFLPQRRKHETAYRTPRNRCGRCANGLYSQHTPRLWEYMHNLVQDLVDNHQFTLGNNLLKRRKGRQCH